MSAVEITKPKRQRSRYSAEPLSRVPDDAEFGPAMLALTPMQRRFVLEWRDGPAGYGALVRAAKAAGYADTNDNTIKAAASRLMASPRVQAALLEIGGKMIRADAFQSIKNVREIANDKNHKDCLKANLALLDRGGFGVETVHHVQVNRTVR